MTLKLDKEFYDSLTSSLHGLFVEYLIERAQESFKDGKTSCVISFQKDSYCYKKDGNILIGTNDIGKDGNIVKILADENFLSILKSRIESPFSYQIIYFNIGCVVTFSKA